MRASQRRLTRAELRIVATEFISLDGVIEDPGGAEGTVHGGWTFQFTDPGKRLFGEAPGAAVLLKLVDVKSLQRAR